MIVLARVRILAIPMLAGLVAGCVYVPGPERLNLYGSERDFRNLSGTSPADPLVDGRMTGPEMTELLGPAPFASADGRVVVYQLSTQRGTWYQLLPLNSVPGGRSFHALALRFTGSGVLQHHRFLTRDVPTRFKSALWEYGPDMGFSDAQWATLDQVGSAEGVDLYDRGGFLVTGFARGPRRHALSSTRATTRLR